MQCESQWGTQENQHEKSTKTITVVLILKAGSTGLLKMQEMMTTWLLKQQTSSSSSIESESLVSWVLRPLPFLSSLSLSSLSSLSLHLENNRILDLMIGKKKDEYLYIFPLQLPLFLLLDSDLLLFWLPSWLKWVLSCLRRRVKSNSWLLLLLLFLFLRTIVYLINWLFLSFLSLTFTVFHFFHFIERRFICDSSLLLLYCFFSLIFSCHDFCWTVLIKINRNAREGSRFLLHH